MLADRMAWPIHRAVLACSLLLLVGCGNNDGATKTGVDQSEVKLETSVFSEVRAVNDAAQPAGPWRFVVISDTHLTASPTHPDNLIFAATGDHLAALNPEVDLVMSTGDNVDDLYVFQEMFVADGPIPVLESYREVIDLHYPMPFHVTLGNHDVRFFGTWMDATSAAEAWLAAFQGTETFPTPYYSLEHRGFLLIALNSTGGATDYESNDKATFDAAQLSWLDQELSRGIPSILFWHHELIPDGVDDDTHPLYPVLAAHEDTVLAVFTGHVHHFDHATWRGIDFYTTEMLKEHDAPVYHLIECDPGDGTISMVEAVKVAPSE